MEWFFSLKDRRAARGMVLGIGGHQEEGSHAPPCAMAVGGFL